jgi:hypothetical protein
MLTLPAMPRLRPSLLLAAVLTSALMPLPAAAHDSPLGWKYPWSCCSNQDCKQMSGTGIQERPNGYVVAATGEVIPYQDKRVKDSPDGEFHWCAHQAGIDAGHTICLFVPPKGY